MPDLFLVGAKLQALNGILIAGNTYKAALFNSSYVSTTAVFGTTNEVTGTGWASGGVTLTGLSTATSGTTAFGDFADSTTPGVTISGARWLVIYDATDNNEIRAAFDLVTDRSVTGGDLVIQFPAAAAGTAVIRIA